MERVNPILDLAREAVAARSGARQVDQAEDDVLTSEVVALIETGIGSGRQRLSLGQVLGMLGDPRLTNPADASYWVQLTLDDGRAVSVGRYLVTTQEFRAWMRISPAHGEPEARGGYYGTEGWSEAGLAWRDSGAVSWDEVSANSDLAHLLVPNHPVVGVNWFEAAAYARAKGARLLTSDERRFVLRGEENRPYPWGEPFGIRQQQHARGRARRSVRGGALRARSHTRGRDQSRGQRRGVARRRRGRGRAPLPSGLVEAAVDGVVGEGAPDSLRPTTGRPISDSVSSGTERIRLTAGRSGGTVRRGHGSEGRMGR